jgi:PAS domain S-box-containing protein
MKHVILIGGQKDGAALFDIIQRSNAMKVVAVIDEDNSAPAMKMAASSGVRTYRDWRTFLDSSDSDLPVDVVIETTNNEQLFRQLRHIKDREWVLIPSAVASLISKQSQEQNMILDSTHDGMIAIDYNEKITLFNKSAERMTGLKKEDAVGKTVLTMIPTSRLPNVLHTGNSELNREQVLENGKKIYTSRTPIINQNRQTVGAFAVFKDITEIVDMAKEVTNLKSVQTMLEAIIHSSEEAISVVDETGKGLMVNPAYSKLTGLSAEEIIGKPAATDISEGESMHMQVLKTRKPVRGVRMKVGPHRRDVIVNVAPVIVDGKIKGSVGVIHDMSEIQSLTDELRRARQIIRTLEAKYTFDDIIGKSQEMKFAVEQAKLGAMTPATVLLRGESGTGKELFAHAIHNESKLKFNKFVRVNCAAISESLLESELFGYEEGAFSGAKKGGKRGLFEEANGGSIFLDEIGELSGNTQAKLLRVLQEQEIIRVGGTKPIPIKVRVIAATNVNLEKRIIEGAFREDLYYRINRLPIHIPSLRARKEDIPLLCEHLIQKINQDYGRKMNGINEGSIGLLQRYDWPGNVRELENVLGRAIIHTDPHNQIIDVLTIPSFRLEKDNQELESYTFSHNPSLTLNERMEEYERQILNQTLKEHNGNKTNTAKALGVSLRNLYYKLEKYNIEVDGTQ